MLRKSAGRWHIMMAGVAMLALAACGSDNGSSEMGAAPQPTAVDGPPTIAGIDNNALSPDTIFNTEIGNTVFFATDAHDLSAEAQGILQRQAQWLLQNPARTASVEGHADERGTREYNLALGERRANSVANYLVALGVDAGRLQITSFGKEQPLCGEAEEACWQRNRRALTALNP